MKKILVTLALALVLVLGCTALASADGGTDANVDGYIVAWGDWASVTTLDGHAVSFLGEDYAKFAPSTCTTFGTAYYKCLEPTHLNGIHAVTIAKRPHVYIEDKTTYVAPTCTEPGWSQQICQWCGKKGELVEIMPNGHTFSGKSYNVIFPATCTKEGYGVIKCDVCGVLKGEAPKTYEEAAAATYEWNADLKLYVGTEKPWVKLQKIAHAYTNWTWSVRSTCYYGGEATRTCVICGDIQYVDENTTLWIDVHGNVLTEKQNLTDKLLKEWAGDIVRKNDKYGLAIEAMNGKTFNNRDELKKVIDDLTKKGVQVVLVSDEEKDCYNRILKYHCPLCDSKIHPIYGCPHPEIVVNLLEPSHVFGLPQFPISNPYSWLSKFYEENGKDAKPEEYVEKLAYTKDASVKPSCELPGIDLYKCIKWNDAHGFVVEDYKLDGYKAVVVPAKGHAWSPWQTTETYTKDGKNYLVRVHVCEVCEKTEHETIEYDPTVNYKQGLVKEGETWRYYVDDKFQADYTGFVAFEGGEFWVTKGVVDTSLNGLVNCPGDKWIFFANGQVQRVTQWAEYAGEWFMIENGELDTTKSGLYDYNGGTFAVAAGRKLGTVNGLWQNPLDGKWYFLSQGQVQKVTQEVTYNGATFNVVDGMLAE